MRGGCLPGMPRRVDETPGTGCRHDCLHRRMVEDYRETKVLADEVRKIAREAACGGGRSDGEEGRDFDRAHPTFTFKQYLTDHRKDRSE